MPVHFKILVVVLVLVLWFAWEIRRALRSEPEPPPLPRCFASDPGPQEAAENDCATCALFDPCHGIRR